MGPESLGVRALDPEDVRDAIARLCDSVVDPLQLAARRLWRDARDSGHEVRSSSRRNEVLRVPEDPRMGEGLPILFLIQKPASRPCHGFGGDLIRRRSRQERSPGGRRLAIPVEIAAQAAIQGTVGFCGAGTSRISKERMPSRSVGRISQPIPLSRSSITAVR